MRLMSLRLENIRSHVDTTIEFGDGVNLFEGDIGSGKSTILLAVEFALFGKAELKATSLLRHGAKEGRVELVFAVKDRVYRATRRLGRSGAGVTTKGCSLEVEGRGTKLSSKEMRQRVLQVLEYGERRNPNAKLDIFTYSVYTPQEDMRTVLTNDARMRDQRKKTLRRALDLEEYDLAASNLDLVRLQLDNDAAELRGMASGLEGALDALARARTALEEERGRSEVAAREAEAAAEGVRRASAGLEEVQEGEARYQAALAASKDAEAALARADGELRELTARLEAARGKEEELEEVRFRIEEHTGTLQDLEGLERIEARLQQMGRELKEATGDLERQRARLEAAREASRRHEELVEVLDGTQDPSPGMEELGDRLRSLREEVIGLGHQMDALKAEEGAIDEEDRELTVLEGKAACPKCKQPLTEEHLAGLLETNRKRRREISSRLREIASKRNRLEGDVREGEETLAELGAVAKERQRTCIEMERAREASAELQQLVEAVEDHPALRLERAIATMEQDLDGERLSQLRRMAGVVEELRGTEARLVSVLEGLPRIEGEHAASLNAIEDARKAHRRASSDLSEISEGRDEGALAISREEHRRALDAEGEARAAAARIEERVAGMEREVERLEGEVGRLEGIMERHDLHGHVSEWLSERVIPAIRSMERSVMALMAEEMDVAASRWFGQLVDDPDLVLSVDEDFVPTVTQEDYEMDLSALSGGERTAAAFAYRLALNGLVRKSATPDQANLLILDEPTDGFSREQLARMGNVLSELAAEQVVLVSHDRELRAFAHRVYAVEKTGGASRVHQVV